MITPDELEALRNRFYSERNKDLIGIHEMTNEEYHNENGLSNSGCFRMDKSINHMLHGGKIENDSLTFGTAVHARLLEPDVWSSAFAKGPKGIHDKRSKKWKEAAFKAGQDGKELLTDSMYDAVEEAARSAKKHPIARQLLNDKSGIPEQSVFVSSRYHNILLKVRPDLWVQDADIIVDVKTTKSASPGAGYGFGRSCGQWRYDKQAAMYTDVMNIATGNEYNFYFVAVESEPPYETVVYRLDDADLKIGHRDYMANVYDLAKYLENPTWAGYSDSVETIKIPGYFRRK